MMHLNLIFSGFICDTLDRGVYHYEKCGLLICLVVLKSCNGIVFEKTDIE